MNCLTEAGVERLIFTGHEYDDDTALSYTVARYYDGDVGKFVSQDPVFLAVGTGDRRAKAALANPQFFNSYSYTANNPLKYVDEQGEFPFVAIAIGGGVGALSGAKGKRGKWR